MTDMQEAMWYALCDLPGEEVLRLLTDWHGLQLLDEGFREHLANEGVMDSIYSDDEIEDDDDEIEDDEDVNVRLAECKARKSDILPLAQAKWATIKNDPDFTKEDALVQGLELLDCNSQSFDLTMDEYDDILNSII